MAQMGITCVEESVSVCHNASGSRFANVTKSHYRNGYTTWVYVVYTIQVPGHCIQLLPFSMNIFFAKDPNLGAMVEADTMPCTDRTYTNRRVGKPHLRRKTAG